MLTIGYETAVTQPERIRRFTADYFRALGASISQEGDLLRVELTPEQVAELEGRTGPRFGLFSRPEPGLTVLYLAFSPTVAEQDERAELVAPGSYRLSQIQSSSRRIGRLGRFTLPPRGIDAIGPELYQPYLLFHICVTLEGKTQQDRLYAIAVDLTKGAINADVARRAQRGPLLDEVPRNVGKRTVGFQAALANALRHVTEQLKSEDDGWAREALLALAAERRSLERYFTQDNKRYTNGLSPSCAGNEQDESEFDPRQLRLAEVEHRCRPKATARLPLCAMVFSPA